MVKSRYGYELKSLDKPAEGWLVAMCKAIGMSGSEVASRMGLSRNAVYQAERNERDGAITINQMQKLPQSMVQRTRGFAERAVLVLSVVR